MPVGPPLLAPTEPVVIVLDTNVMLDLLVFGDAAAQGLAAALKAGRLRPVSTPAMLDELADVLSRPFLTDWPVAGAAVLAKARTMCQPVVAPPAPAIPAPRCADPDDQKFIDLAWAWPARWLFSRDRAVLALAQTTQARGLSIVTPASWAAMHGTGSAEPGVPT